MISTYNYLATNYLNNYPSVKNNLSHNKKELKNIYNDIVKMNSESPLYMFDMTEKNQEFAVGIKDATYSLYSLLSKFSSNKDIFDKTTLASTDNSIASVMVNNDSSTDDINDFFITVHKMATAQENTGRSVASNTTGLTPGKYSFDINVFEESYSFQFPVGQGMNNYEIQKELSNFINAADIGIEARVEHDAKDSRSQITLTSTSTGSGINGTPAFTITDTTKFDGRGIVEYFNLDNTTKQGNNASFNLNGIDRETRGNSFTYNNLMTISLHSESDKPVLITRTTNSEKIVDSLETITTSYNSLIDTAVNNTEKGNEPHKLVNSIESSIYALRNSMESCGITLDATGHMVVDKSLAYQAADDGDLKDLLINSDGMINGLKHKVKDISMNPMEFIQKTIVTYPNHSKPAVNNPYVTSIYSGMLFDYHC